MYVIPIYQVHAIYIQHANISNVHIGIFPRIDLTENATLTNTSRILTPVYSLMSRALDDTLDLMASPIVYRENNTATYGHIYARGFCTPTMAPTGLSAHSPTDAKPTRIIVFFFMRGF